MASKMININQDTTYAEYICDTVADLSTLKYKEKQFFGSISHMYQKIKSYIF